MSKEAMKLAWEAEEKANPQTRYNSWCRGYEAALREALAKPDFWEGYVPEPDSTCNNTLRAQGKAYPRTCKKCGLGPCVGLAQQALDKKAENARELGLDYEPAQQEFVSPGGGYVPAIPVQQRPIKTFHGGKAWPVQEPAQPVPDAFEQLMREADKPTQVPEEIAKCVNALMDGMHEITSVTIRPKRTWVSLTDEELSEVYNQADWDTVNGWEYERAIEAKLRSKNEDRN